MPVPKQTPWLDEEADPGVHVNLKFTYPKGTAVIELSRNATKWLGLRLAAAGDRNLEEPLEIELRGPGRYVGAEHLDEHHAITALGQTLGLIDRAGFLVLYPDGDGDVYLNEQLHRMRIKRK